MNDLTQDQIDVRLAAKFGNLDKLDPALLTPENVLPTVVANGKPLLAPGPQNDGPIQMAARHGQLPLLPPSARTVEALLLCGHPLRDLPDPLDTFEDAFHDAVVCGTLDKLPADDEFKRDLLLRRDQVKASITRGIATLESGPRESLGTQVKLWVLGDTSLSQKAVDKARDWMETALQTPEERASNQGVAAIVTATGAVVVPRASLPEIPHVPKDLAVPAAGELSNRERAGK